MKYNGNKILQCTALLILITTCYCCSFKSNMNEIKKAKAVIAATNDSTQVSGLVTFTQRGADNVKMQIEISVPSRANRMVAVHIHEHGMCGNMGGDAHGHWNPTGSQHGKWGSPSFHAGDIGNIQLDANGKGTLTLETNAWSIGGDSTKNILHRGIIVHAGVDDYKTQPSGNSGARIGCGEIVQQ
jgi:Cu-Zn family superoxide dismutase